VAGLFGATGTSAVIQNLGVTMPASATPATAVGSAGAIVGMNAGTVMNSYATGELQSTTNTGGLVGTNTGTVTNSYSTVRVKGTSNVGGLVGTNSGTISNVYASGSA
jgi:trimeric autotransporter adhesin